MLKVEPLELKKNTHDKKLLFWIFFFKPTNAAIAEKKTVSLMPNPHQVVFVS